VYFILDFSVFWICSILIEYQNQKGYREMGKWASPISEEINNGGCWIVALAMSWN